MVTVEWNEPRPVGATIQVPVGGDQLSAGKLAVTKDGERRTNAVRKTFVVRPSSC